MTSARAAEKETTSSPVNRLDIEMGDLRDHGRMARKRKEPKSTEIDIHA